MTEKLLKAIETGIKKEEKSRDHFYITDIGKACDGCLRSLYLDFKNVPKKETGIGKLLMFEHGNKIHETIGTIISESGLFKNVEIEKSCELIIDDCAFGGRYDCKADGAIIDFKTMRGAAFQYLTEPKPSHVAQVQAYIMAENVNDGYVMYIDREGQNGFVVFGIGRDDENVTRLARECINAKENEPRLLTPIFKKEVLKTKTNYYVQLPWQCSYCDYYGLSCDGAMSQDLDIGKQFAAEEKNGTLSIKQGFESYFKDMEKFNEV